jgi:thioredoxin-like negative regulator of GroEL
MEGNKTTVQIDTELALSGYALFKDGQYRAAIPLLLEILDLDTRNWQARLLLAACYHKTGQSAAALRALRFVYDNCVDAQLKQKSCLALQAVNASLQQAVCTPAEFGSVNTRLQVQPARVETIVA